MTSPGCTGTTRNLSFSLQLKSHESTKHDLIQMLFAIYWRYWQTGKNARKFIKVQGRFMQAHFIEIYQVFTEKNKVWYFSNRVV